MRIGADQNGRQGRRARALGLSAAVIALAASALWLQRAPIAEAVIGRYLKGQGVPASYRIDALGTRRAVLSHVRIGDPARPDFTADRVVVDVAWRGGMPTPARAVLQGAVLKAEVRAGGLSFGALDRLIPASDEPFSFPELNLTVERSAMSLATAVGRLDATLEGRGQLSNGFRGRVRLAPSDLRQAGCGVTDLRGGADIRIIRRVLVAGGSFVAPTAGCGASLQRLSARFDARLPEPLDRIDARLALGAEQTIFSGARARDVAVGLSATGRADMLRGRWSIGTGDLAARSATGRTDAAGRYHANLTAGELGLSGDVRASVQGRGDLLRRLLVPVAPASTPFRPLEEHLRAALARAARRADLRATVRLEWRNGSGVAHLSDVEAVAASGLRLSLGSELAVTLPDGRIAPRGALTIAGGGFPNSRLRFERTTSGTMAAEFAMAPWQAGGARAAVPGLRLAYAGGQGTIKGRVELSGPVTGGRVDGLRLPVDFAVDFRRGARLDAAGCLHPSFEQLALSGYRAGRTVLAFCPQDGLPLVALTPDGRLSGGASLRSLDLRLGSALGEAYRVRAGTITAGLGGTATYPKLSIRGVDLAADVGGADVSLAELSGTLNNARHGWTGSGRLSGGKAAGALPATLEAGRASWSLASDGTLRLTDGSILARDAQPEPRYQPVRLANIVGELRRGTFMMTADAIVAAKGVRLAGVRLRHDLSAGAGRADLSVDRFAFGESIQPYEVSEIARGVVENAVGPLTGEGVVRWDASGVSSSGALTLGGISFATAALGPVDDVRGTIRFDDLLALTTPPGQSVTIGRINPGVAVENGVFRFQLLASHDVRIEGAEWPFAGGRLMLDPTLFELNATGRRYTLRVASIEAAQFLQQFDFKNLNVTGRFSGVLPLLFDAGGGRIESGRLMAERGGGVIQYVGEVGRESMGAAARLAFDALRKMRYDSLAIELDGALDGEIVTGVRFSGVNEAPVNPSGGRVPVSATGLPFRFNLTVRAPFRALLNSAASLGDVRPIIRSGLPVDPDSVPGVSEPK